MSPCRFNICWLWNSAVSTPPRGVRRSPVRFRQPGVDNARTPGLYTDHTVRRRLGAMARLRSSSLIFGDQPPISIGGVGFGGSPVIRGGGLLDPGLFDR